MKLINPILLTLNNTLHIKADNLEPEKEDKCDGKCVPNECLCEWEDMTKEQVKAEALPSITEKYGKSFEKSYTIEEIEKAINGLNMLSTKRDEINTPF